MRCTPYESVTHDSVPESLAPLYEKAREVLAAGAQAQRAARKRHKKTAGLVGVGTAHPLNSEAEKGSGVRGTPYETGQGNRLIFRLSSADKIMGDYGRCPGW